MRHLAALTLGLLRAALVADGVVKLLQLLPHPLECQTLPKEHIL